MKKNQPTIVLTGDRPTGKLHLGHFLGSIENRLNIQEKGALNGKHVDGIYYMIADVQALTDNATHPEKVRDSVLEVALDNLACGMGPEKTTMFIQSEIPQIAELTVFFMNLVTISRLKQNPTVKTEIKQKGFGENVPLGFLAYPISQAADILTFKANYIPVGEDQKPVIEQANEIVAKFNSFYGDTFGYINAIIPEKNSKASRVPGIDGKAKMSKSLGNAIYISDSPKETEKKVMQMYTDEQHIHVSDPGKVEGNVVFTYLDLFDPNKEEVSELKKQYRKGGLGDVVLKKRLIAIINAHFAEIRERRSVIAKNPKAVIDILKEGSIRARKIALSTLEEVKEVMKINYF